ncbi:MAG TPA: LemA family protein [Chitinophagaceae bacterium]|nr:LemA family protein [Chitinophagaceae bacterium]
MKIYYTAVLFISIAFGFSCSNNSQPPNEDPKEGNNSPEFLTKWTALNFANQRRNDVLKNLSNTVKLYSNGNSNISDNILNDWKKSQEVLDTIRHHGSVLQTTDIEKYLTMQSQFDVDEKALLSYINNTENLKTNNTILQSIKLLETTNKDIETQKEEFNKLYKK